MDIAEIVRQCRQEYEAGLQHKQGRVKDWQATEDQYYGRVKKTLKGRFNVPMPIMSGFVDTLLSKVDDAPLLRFKHAEEADFRVTQKTQAFYDTETKSTDNDYDSLDLDGKKLAIFSGRATFKCYGESLPKFRYNIFNTDHYDFYCDPMGGGHLENHRYLGEDNIFKSKSQLIEGAKAGRYIKLNVGLLVNNLTENVIQDNDNAFKNKANRLEAIGLSANVNNFAGEGLQRFIESGTTVNGVRFYVLWNYATGLAIRCEPIKQKMFKSGLWWHTSWATHRDAFNFWSKAPADDIRPVAEVIRVLANQELDNRQKKNWGMRAYDPAVFPDGAELEYRPNGLVAVTAGASKVQAIANGIFEFQTPELTGTINLIQWMDGIIGQKSGVTADTQGASVEDKVGIYQGNMQQVADRLGLYNKAYVKCHAAIGRRFVWAVHENLTKAAAVKLIGEKGVEWDKLTGREVNPEMDILVESGTAEMRLDEERKKIRTESLAAIKSDPNLAPAVNKKWLVEQFLRNGDYSDEDIRVALDTENDGNREVLAKASESIQDIINGKTPKLVRNATTGFQQKILDFALDNTDDDLQLFNKLTAYAGAHDEIVQENMMRKAMRLRAQQGQGLPTELPQMGPGPQSIPQAVPVTQ